jgi:hypothetical protein
LHLLLNKYKKIDWLVEIAHTYHEVNMCADALANIWCSLDYDIMFFDSCPSQISEICEKDRVGNTIPRLVLDRVGLGPHHYQKKKLHPSLLD